MRAIHCGLGGDDLGLGLGLPSHGIVPVAHTDGFLRQQALDALRVQPGSGQRSLLPGQLALGLLQCGQESARVDFIQQLAFLDLLALAVILLNEITCHLGQNLRVHHAVQAADPFLLDGHVPLFDLDDLDHRRQGRRRGFGLLAAAQQGQP